MFAGSDTVAGILTQPSRATLSRVPRRVSPKASWPHELPVLQPSLTDDRQRVVLTLVVGFSLSPFDTRQAVPARALLRQQGGILDANHFSRRHKPPPPAPGSSWAPLEHRSVRHAKMSGMCHAFIASIWVARLSTASRGQWPVRVGTCQETLRGCRQGVAACPPC